MSLKNPNLLGRLVPSSCPVVARRAKSDLFGEVLTKTEAGSEAQSPYNRVFDPEKCRLRLKNEHIWEVS